MTDIYDERPRGSAEYERGWADAVRIWRELLEASRAALRAGIDGERWPGRRRMAQGMWEAFDTMLEKGPR